MTRFRIHIGAHKTATTHLQDSLLQAAKTLRAHQILYIPRREFREKRINSQIAKVTNEAASGAPNRMTLAGLLRQHADLSETVILSEENIIGSSYSLLNGLYPDASARLARWKTLTDQSQVSVFISIRNYKDILPSAYAQALRDGTRPPKFENILEYWIKARPNWLRLIHMAVALFGKESVTVWTFEKYVQDPMMILNELSGLKLRGIDLGKSDQYHRLSAGAVAKIEQIDRQLPPGERLKQIRAIEKAPQSGLYDPICEGDKDILSRRYEQDCAAIRALGVTFFE